MLRWLSDRKHTQATALELYGSSVAQSRLPGFYRELCVADTFSGRFELVMLHVGLLLRRLTAEGDAGKELGRVLVERMFAILDDDMREIGISDLSVAKKMQTAASSFYGRLKAYDAALAQPGGAALSETLTRNIPASEGKLLQAAPLSGYVRTVAESLSKQPFASFQQGLVTFPAPVVSQ